MILAALLIVALAGPADQCAAFEASEPTLYYAMGVPPSDLPAVSDDQAIANLTASPNDPVAQRIAIARTRVWNTLAYKLDADGHITTGGTWRVGPVTDPVSGFVFDTVHWADVDDDSWTLYFVGTKLCAVVYEN